MVVDSLSDETLGLLNRLNGSPDAGFVLDLVSQASLHVPVLIDTAAVADAVRPYGWLLHRIGGEGIALTSAGYLPPAVVLDTVTALGWEREWIGKHNREYHTLPVLELRESARRMGLVRKHRGRLLRTALGQRLAADPTTLWWHLASRLPEGRTDAEKDAGVLLLLAVAAGTPLNWQVKNDLLRRGMAALGWQVAGSGRPLEEWEAFEAARDTWTMLGRVGALPDATYRVELSPPPPAGVAFARAALRRPVG